MKRLVVMGSAPCLEEDLERILGGLHNAPLYDFCAVGLDCADRWLGRIEHAVSYHPKEFPAFRERRAAAGGNLDYIQHSHGAVSGLEIRVWPYFSPSGSSAMLGVEAGLGMGYDRIVVAGVLLQDGGYRRFQEGWKVRLKKIKEKTRAMSGFPRELLGEPTGEWLNE
jgi:hypothetical protein